MGINVLLKQQATSNKHQNLFKCMLLFIIDDIMIRISGEIIRMEKGKNTFVLSYYWDENDENDEDDDKKVKYSGTLPGKGEIVFMIEKNDKIDKIWIYHGGGKLNLYSDKNVPKEVMNAWNKAISKI